MKNKTKEKLTQIVDVVDKTKADIVDLRKEIAEKPPETSGIPPVDPVGEGPLRGNPWALFWKLLVVLLGLLILGIFLLVLRFVAS